MFNSLPKKLAAAAVIAAAMVFPVSTSLAATTLAFSADTTVANATTDAGTMNWASSTSATYNQVVAVQVVYDNNEAADSGKTVTNLNVKINIPTTAGASQTVTTTTSGDNIKTVTGNAQVNLGRSDAYLQYIPGTATWKHATTANGPMTTTQKVSDDVVLGANGLNLGTENPCQAGSVVVEARVMVPGVSVDKYVRESGTTNWATSINAKVGDTIQYEIAYKNTGNTTENDVEFRDQLPQGITYVPGSTKLKSGNYPNGLNVTSDALVASNGITTGDYAPGAAGYVMFDAKVTGGDNLVCGQNTLRNIAFVQPTGMNYYYNTADVVVTKQCANTPTYSCDQFHVTAGDNRTVTVDAFKTSQSNGATFKNAVINWGDQSQALTTNSVVGQKHTYAADGTYTLTATAHFDVNGQDVATTGSCTQVVKFTTPGTPPTTTPPTQLVNTGAGSVVGIAAVVAVVSAFAYNLLGRRLSRQ
ncbi:MAG TPA: DUF11 domain-containing protein [Candidatus Microsaccharimonas sp.]|nr:DUF11 domain-containing protein [Candidatus Microsaccharimonas sp.]